MKQLLRWTAFLTIGLGVTASAQAVGWLSTSIAQVELDSSGSINVYFTNNSDCGSNRLTYVNSVIGSDDAKAMLAALLSWQAQGKPVNVYVANCNGGTYGQFTAAYNQ